MSRGTLIHMTRSTIVFEVYNPYSIVQLSEVLQQVVIRRGNSAIYDGKAVVSSLVNTGLMLVVSATLVDAWHDLAFVVSRRSDLRDTVRAFIGEWEQSKQIRPGYQIAVSDIKSFLSQLSPWLDQVDIADEEGPTKLSTEKFEQLKESLLPKVQELQQRFEYEARRVTPDEFESHRLSAQRDLLPLMMRAPFFHRSYSKPLGYAGDYMMVKMMVEGERAGPTTYARIVNDFYLEIDLVKAHRNRLTLLERRLTELASAARDRNEKLAVLNVGCGPAIELVRFIMNSPLSESCEFHLIDFNAETIAFAKDQIDRVKGESRRWPKTIFTQQSVHSLLKSAAQGVESNEPKYDFIYCAGLFDYLSDRVCQRLLSLFAQWTKPGGNVLATNVHPDNPTRFMMEHVIEWHLIHRTMEDLKGLAPARFRPHMYDDTTHMNVFVEFVVSP